MGPFIAQIIRCSRAWPRFNKGAGLAFRFAHFVIDLASGPQNLRAFFQRDPLVRREFRLQHRYRAGATDESWQRQRDAKCGVAAADRNCHALVAQYHLGNSCRRYADAILTGVVTLDDRDVGGAKLALDSRAPLTSTAPEAGTR
jgi:hypothetical protein